VRTFALLAVLVAAWVAASSPREAHAQDTASVTSKTRFECPGCLTPAQPDAERCTGCGVSFKKLEYECPKCKAAIAWDATRCASCGLGFDAPSANEKEKRSAKERSMPATRDFIKNSPDAEAKKGIEVHGRSLTLWRTGRELSFDGTTTIHRFVEDLSVNVLNLGVPELSFHGQAELLGDPNLRPQNSVQPKLREAYFRYQTEDASTQIQAGRQWINSGVARSFVDSLFWHQMLGDRLGFEVHGGHPVSTNKDTPGGDIEFGTRVFWRGLPKVVSRTFRDLTLGFSYREELWSSRVVRRDLGFDFSFSPTWSVDISGHAYYSAVVEDIYDARFTFVARPTDWAQLTFDYRYIVPSALLPANSMFMTFADDLRHELELDLDLYPSDRLKLRGYARAYVIPNDSFNTALTNVKIDLDTEVPYELGTGFSLKHGQVVKGELGAEASILVKSGIHRFEGATVRHANILQFRVYEMVSYDVADVHTIKGSIDLHLEAYSGKVYRRQNSAGTLTLTAGYVYDHKYSFTIGGDYRSSPNFTNTYDVFAKIEVPF
jgi:hypothetical protein